MYPGYIGYAVGGGPGIGSGGGGGGGGFLRFSFSMLFEIIDSFFSAGVGTDGPGVVIIGDI